MLCSSFQDQLMIGSLSARSLNHIASCHFGPKGKDLWLHITSWTQATRWLLQRHRWVLIFHVSALRYSGLWGTNYSQLGHWWLSLLVQRLGHSCCLCHEPTHQPWPHNSTVLDLSAGVVSKTPSIYWARVWLLASLNLIFLHWGVGLVPQERGLVAEGSTSCSALTDSRTQSGSWFHRTGAW